MMPRRPLPFVFAFVATLVLFAAGCRSCGGDKTVAEVKRHQGDVTRDTASTQQKWEPAPDGAKLAMGDGLRTGASSEAIVKLARGGTLKLPPETTIRFLTGAPGTSGAGKLAIEAGEASIEAESGEVTIETTIGVARIESGGTLRIAAGPGGATRFEVSIGAARIDTEDGGVALSPGKAFEISLGGAIVERDIVDASADAAKRVETPAPAVVDAGPGAVAAEVHGKGARVQARGSKTWQPLAEGTATVGYGDLVEVPSGVSIDVRRGADHGRLVGAGRFVVGEGEGALVTANAGKVELDATSDDVLVAVPGGIIVAKSGGSRVAVDVGAGGTKATVLRGEAEVRGKTTESLRAGEGAAVNTKGAVALSGRGPDRADFFATAGESLVIRDPRPPTALGFDFSSVCSGPALVARGDVSARGDKRAALFFPPGVHNYTVRCIGPDGLEEKPAATGVVTVVADAARAELPRLPPSTVVDMDGRRYTVLYQNLLPSVVARWQEAPASAGGYALHLDGQTLKADGARHSFRSGSVTEGSHTLWFATADGAKKSPETTLVIKFDNAAPAASVREPEDGSFKPGDSVKVSGVVVEGWTVAVNGQPVPLDEQRRFSTTTTAAVSDNAVVIRLSHPQRGTVHYVRHAGAAK